MRYEIRSISVWTTIKVGFFLNLITGFGLGVMYAFFSMVTLAVSSGLMGYAMGFSAMTPEQMLLMLPPLFAFGNAFFGTLLLAFIALFYNLIARLLGGVELVLVADTERSVASAPLRRPAAETTRSAVSGSLMTPPPPPPPVIGSRRDTGETRSEARTAETPPPLRPAIETSTTSGTPDTVEKPNDPRPDEATFTWPEQVSAIEPGDRGAELSQEDVTDGAEAPREDDEAGNSADDEDRKHHE
ncbi:MAG: DUF3566 domain-containing protein [candidate division Zixibacteria bacterium]|jgi:hypothetical protein|nr:DUF3566 domain-containing protein [candidate division Zixibacteria bacterium]